MRMYGGLLLVKEEEFHERKQGNIFLPNDNEFRKVFTRGTVIQVGPGVRLEDTSASGELVINHVPIGVEPGDVIIFHRRNAIPILDKFDRGKEMLVIREPDIVAILDPEDLRDKGEITDVTNN